MSVPADRASEYAAFYVRESYIYVDEGVEDCGE